MTATEMSVLCHQKPPDHKPASVGRPLPPTRYRSSVREFINFYFVLPCTFMHLHTFTPETCSEQL